MRFNLSELEMYPDILSKEQLRIWGHMSKRTASRLLESGLLPSKYNGKKSRCYQIYKKDIIDFLNSYTPPEDNSLGFTPTNIDYAVLLRYYRSKMEKYDDILTVYQTSDITGYGITTIRKWLHSGKLKYLLIRNRYKIPKEYLLDFLITEQYNHIERKSHKHIRSLWSAQRTQ